MSQQIASSSISTTHRLSFFISYTAHAADDLVLAKYLANEIPARGHDAFIDSQLEAGVRWSDQLESKLDSCNRFIVLLSSESVKHDMVAAEVRRACARARTGACLILPVRVRYDGVLPLALDAEIHPHQYIAWNGTHDNEIVLAKVLDSTGAVDSGNNQQFRASEALLRLLEGNSTLARLSAEKTLRANREDAQALYVRGLLELQHPIAELDPHSADRAEKFLREAADCGLEFQCAFPRIALRYDHYRNWPRAEPTPSLNDLVKLYSTHREEAELWPFGILNSRLPTSGRFKAKWKN